MNLLSAYHPVLLFPVNLIEESYPPTQGRRESDLAVPTLSIGGEIKDDTDNPQKKIMFGTTMTYDANAASAKSSHEVGEKVWSKFHRHFELRIGRTTLGIRRNLKRHLHFINLLAVIYISPPKIKNHGGFIQLDADTQKTLIAHEKIASINMAEILQLFA